MSELREAYTEFVKILGEIGAQAGEEVFDLWADRVAHGREPMPYDALVHLAMWSMRMCDQARARSRGPDPRCGAQGTD